MVLVLVQTDIDMQDVIVDTYRGILYCDCRALQQTIDLMPSVVADAIQWGMTSDNADNFDVLSAYIAVGVWTVFRDDRPEDFPS
jgi:ABC-type long-subunit fatty acid transport system fused permease/ATPase subunit